MKLEVTVERKRKSVTQGIAEVYFNGVLVQSFRDDIAIIEQGKQYFGPVVGGWASVVSDLDFIRAVLVHKYEAAYNYHEPMRKALNKIESEAEEAEERSVYIREKNGSMSVISRGLNAKDASADADWWHKKTGRTAVVVVDEDKGVG